MLGDLLFAEGDTTSRLGDLEGDLEGDLAGVAWRGDDVKAVACVSESETGGRVEDTEIGAAGTRETGVSATSARGEEGAGFLAGEAEERVV